MCDCTVQYCLRIGSIQLSICSSLSKDVTLRCFRYVYHRKTMGMGMQKESVTIFIFSRGSKPAKLCMQCYNASYMCAYTVANSPVIVIPFSRWHNRGYLLYTSCTKIVEPIFTDYATALYAVSKSATQWWFLFCMLTYCRCSKSVSSKSITFFG